MFAGKRIHPKKSVKWLGVHLDHKLTINEHVQNMTNKALEVVSFLNSLRGSPPPKAAEIAAKVCAVPMALYCAA
jgi:hypothetical protein